MAGLKDTKRRIASVKSTQKITKAMKLVSSAKLAKANIAGLQARPYQEAILSIARSMLSKEAFENIPLLKPRAEKKVLLVVLASDRGLCGGLNANLVKKADRFLEEKKVAQVEMKLGLWGKRCFALQKTRKEEVIERKEKVATNFDFNSVQRLTEGLRQRFVSGEFDAIYIGYSAFKNAISQVPQIERLFPLPLEDGLGSANDNFLVEPDRATLLEHVLERLASVIVYKVFLAGSASEHAARMTAMDSATNNADEVISRLTLEYNRARQAAITKELIEITSGAEAL